MPNEPVNDAPVDGSGIAEDRSAGLRQPTLAWVPVALAVVGIALVGTRVAPAVRPGPPLLGMS